MGYRQFLLLSLGLFPAPPVSADERIVDEYFVGSWQNRLRVQMSGISGSRLRLQSRSILRPFLGQGLLFGRGRSSGVPSASPRRDSERLGSVSVTEGPAISGAGLRLQGSWWRAVLLAGVLRWDARIDASGTAVTLLDDGDHSGSGARTRDRLQGSAIARPLDDSSRCAADRDDAPGAVVFSAG
jgi:hypothetical protein